MKTIRNVLIGLFICVNGLSQTSSDLSTVSSLSSSEVNALNTIFIKKRKDFDFKEKVVAFTGGIRGTDIENKVLFFDKYLNPVVEGKSRNVCALIFLTEEEKLVCGFDAIVMSPCKLFTKKDRKKLISKLKME